jgi:hypothetical protein
MNSIGTKLIWVKSEKRVSPDLLPNLLKRKSRRIVEVSFSLESLDELSRFPEPFQSFGIARWEFDPFFFGRGKTNRNAFTFYLELVGKRKSEVLRWLVKDGMRVNWGVWDNSGDPLYYWNRKKGMAFEYELKRMSRKWLEGGLDKISL